MAVRSEEYGYGYTRYASEEININRSKQHQQSHQEEIATG
jgi:hypothetical protein